MLLDLPVSFSAYIEGTPGQSGAVRTRTSPARVMHLEGPILTVLGSVLRLLLG